MQTFKERWEIQHLWQLIFPFLGLAGLLVSGYLIGNRIITALSSWIPSTLLSSIGILLLTVLFAFLFLKITLWLFTKLAVKWEVTYRWELIAIFIVFAITGSTSARISTPLLHWIGISTDSISGWIYWPLRILIIFPVYQVLLILFGWLFGQFKFFWKFEKKMLRRMGFAKFLKE